MKMMKVVKVTMIIQNDKYRLQQWRNLQLKYVRLSKYI